MLEHVRREHFLGESVERRDEPDEHKRDGEPEEHGSVPAGVVRAAAPPQPHEALNEEPDRERSGDEHRRRRLPARAVRKHRGRG